ncbi:oligosaccharide flippase family protein [Mangrovicoccus sp. HB161399]|uniref:oligosaccharide flippase family protein n=1 Tax=Mangrovicoccus sp. HB161399 TaxID=2720392 RepID=UPI0021105ADF|nr:oligosaccharide flippase family protein [Mangrovicoccus sp. HB161399]
MILKATSIMFASELSVTLVLFFRNILVARLISVEDFGIASTFAVPFAVIETLGNMALNKLIIQDPRGEDPVFCGTLHSVQLIRGAIGAAATLAVAYPYAHFMQTPDIVWAYQCLALIPLALGFLNLDIYRVQRQMDFMPYAIAMVVSPVASLAVILVVWTVSPDYRTMLWGIIAQQVLQVVLSHVLAKRRFGLAWNRDHLRRAMQFGRPLLLNGLAFLVITNGERLIVGNQTDLTVLAWFSTAFLLATAPTRIVINTSMGLFLPKLSARQEDGPGFAGLTLLSVELNLWLGAMAMAGIAVFGPALILGLFGERYAPGMGVLALSFGAGLAMPRIRRDGLALLGQRFARKPG